MHYNKGKYITKSYALEEIKLVVKFGIVSGFVSKYQSSICAWY